MNSDWYHQGHPLHHLPLSPPYHPSHPQEEPLQEERTPKMQGRDQEAEGPPLPQAEVA